jgi:hypothetical protein
MLVDCNVNAALPPDDKFYITFILDNGANWDYNKYIPTEYVIIMENISNIEEVSIIIRDNLGIKEEVSSSDSKKLRKLDFHTFY